MNVEVDQSGVGVFLSPLGSHLIDSCKSQPWQINKRKEDVITVNFNFTTPYGLAVMTDITG